MNNLKTKMFRLLFPSIVWLLILIVFYLNIRLIDSNKMASFALFCAFISVYGCFIWILFNHKNNLKETIIKGFLAITAEILFLSLAGIKFRPEPNIIILYFFLITYLIYLSSIMAILKKLPLPKNFNVAIFSIIFTLCLCNLFYITHILDLFEPYRENITTF